MVYLYIVLSLLFFITRSHGLQNDCTYINGQSCMNGSICKFCGMCLPSSCVLATPYSTGVNQGSTCTATSNQGYDFFDYCLASGTDDNGDSCNTSTICYFYRQGNVSSAMHSWDSLTCDLDTCSLINLDGSPPATPIPLDNSTTVTTSTPITNTNPNPNSTYHPSAENGNSRGEHRNAFDFRNGNPVAIAVTVLCIIVSICLLVCLIRFAFYKTKYWPWINQYFCCGRCTYTPKDQTDSTEPNSAPPSFHQTMQQQNNSHHSLPSYNNQGPSPPKYEQAIVTQIRGMHFLDHHPLGETSTRSTINQQQPIWVPVYLSSTSALSMPAGRLFHQQQDWATQTHQPVTPSTSSSHSIAEEGVDIGIHQNHHSSS